MSFSRWSSRFDSSAQTQGQVKPTAPSKRTQARLRAWSDIQAPPHQRRCQADRASNLARRQRPRQSNQRFPQWSEDVASTGANLYWSNCNIPWTDVFFSTLSLKLEKGCQSYCQQDRRPGNPGQFSSVSASHIPRDPGCDASTAPGCGS